MSLAPQHLDDLRKSGLSDETIQDGGFESVRPHDINRTIGWDVPGLESCYRIAYPGTGFERFRCFYEEGKPGPKYLQRKGTGGRLYLPHSVGPILQDTTIDLCFTEGEKKALKAAQEGLTCIGLSGLWNWKNKGEDNLIADFDQISLAGRNVCIVPDSDWLSPNRHGYKKNLSQAVYGLGEKLKQRGAQVFIVSLPDENEGKTGLDDFLLRHTVEEFKALPTTEILSLQERVQQATADTYRDLLEEITSAEPIEKELLTKALSKRLGVSCRTLKTELGVFAGSDENKKEAIPIPIALGPTIIDIVDHFGQPAFLTTNGEIVRTILNDDQAYCPPRREALPFLLPKSEAVLNAIKQDSDSRLYDDVRAYIYQASDLPGDAYYDLLTACTLHTYLIEKSEYTPIIWFYAVPERGKSRTGRALIYLAYRGLHVESLRDAYLVRISNDLGAGLFFDVTELWKKSEKNGTEDILLSRYERGAMVPRVLYPERGAHNDIVYYSIYGPTIAATNENLPAALDSRAIQINMPPATRNFTNDITPELALPLKARLVAFRYRHMTTALPDVEKPSKGRLGDILKPLAQIIRLVQPKREQSFMCLVGEIEERRGIDRGDSPEAKLTRVIIELGDQVSYGRLPVKSITEKLNEGTAERYQVRAETVGRRLTALGFQKVRAGVKGDRFIIYDEGLIKKLSLTYLGKPSEPSEPSKATNDADLRSDSSTDGSGRSGKPSVELSDGKATNDAGFGSSDSTDSFSKGVSEGKTFFEMPLEDSEPIQGDLPL